MFKNISLLMISLYLVLITYNQSGYQAGSSARTTCSSVYPVNSIQWRNLVTNERLASTTHGETLDLVIHNVSSDFHKTLYECEVNFLLPSGATATSANNFTLQTC